MSDSAVEGLGVRAGIGGGHWRLGALAIHRRALVVQAVAEGLAVAS